MAGGAKVDPEVVAVLRAAKLVEPELSGALMGSPMTPYQASAYQA